jgi:TPR repeat protein
LAQWGFEQGCNLGDGAGCRLLGMMHLYGNGMVRDEPGARKLIAQGCKDGDKEACHLVKAMGM